MRALAADIASIDARRYEGRIAGVQGLTLEATGPAAALGVGARARIETHHGPASCEIVGFHRDRAVLMPFGPMDGVSPGARIDLDAAPATARPSRAWLGRVLDAFGKPMDGLPPPVDGVVARLLEANPPSPGERARVGARIDLGVRVLNTFAPLCRGQRMGLFAGSGVGKSVLLSMLARRAEADVVVIGLVGERGREVREFVEDTLGPEGLARAVVIVATSDAPALVRRQAAYLTMAVAEHFRDEGDHVLCLIDSITRFALAQREIGLAAGEPPTTRGYTPSVFATLPRLLERAGPGPEHTGRASGAITGLFTVLVDGGDHDEPVADAVRGILDGHIVMERAIAERGRYPAVNVLKSVSRMMPHCASPEENKLIRRARKLLATYGDMEELIRLGAYAPGSNPEVDEAVSVQPALDAFLNQPVEETTSIPHGFAMLARALDGSE